MMDTDNSEHPPASHQTEHDWTTDTTLTQTIIQAVATTLHTDRTNLDPLYETIDPDALNQLFAPTSNNDRQLGQFSFPYNGCRVDVFADGAVEITQYDD